VAAECSINLRLLLARLELPSSSNVEFLCQFFVLAPQLDDLTILLFNQLLLVTQVAFQLVKSVLGGRNYFFDP